MSKKVLLTGETPRNKFSDDVWMCDSGTTPHMVKSGKYMLSKMWQTEIKRETEIKLFNDDK